ncbi:BEM_HP_G0080300.mRNA.1.CDS.1 [Saccharomyces cerevisiae]|nr:BEM_HP_G0080300.mRNA.1.CDS.1 [Saccharomyces cerevisiae]CAI6992062.1 BEM_HP_G0080300.mRNA.1.CDS.1 [Saccharomyces cerevisiae]
MKEAGVELITLHGSQNSKDLIPIFEEALSSSTDSALKENVIILYGTLARHLQQSDARIHTIIERLLSTLDTPSADIQQAVSVLYSTTSFPVQTKKVGDYLGILMEKLLNPTVASSMRKGAAWGYRWFSERLRYLGSLGEVFEPYVIEILPNILKNLGMLFLEVRDATARATKAIMAHTTGYGVKKLIPVAVSNLDEIAWRTKRALFLSTIVPEIVGVLNDSHKEVRKAADESLKRFGEVIRTGNSELVPVLLQAIVDPTKYTEEALDPLIQTQFVHYID